MSLASSVPRNYTVVMFVSVGMSLFPFALTYSHITSEQGSYCLNVLEVNVPANFQFSLPPAIWLTPRLRMWLGWKNRRMFVLRRRRMLSRHLGREWSLNLGIGRHQLTWMLNWIRSFLAVCKVLIDDNVCLLWWVVGGNNDWLAVLD